MDKLRVVSWNCQCGLEYGNSTDKKNAVKRLLDKADILILQELTENDFKSLGHSSERSDWYGDDKDAYKYEPLGVAVFTKEGFTVERLYKGEMPFRYILPYKISRLSDGESLTLFAVWTKKEPFEYDENLYEALKYYKPFNRTTIVIGDYNVGARDGAQDRFEKLKKNMGDVDLANCAKGDEITKPTSVWHKDAYQNDFCFASDKLAANAALKVLDDDVDHKLSDHCPIFVDFVL
jgi:endonuclease/exonuclease/phosphatase family metal-dependent hydrolase